jgi:hypothetical protein
MGGDNPLPYSSIRPCWDNPLPCKGIRSGGFIPALVLRILQEAEFFSVAEPAVSITADDSLRPKERLLAAGLHPGLLLRHVPLPDQF